MNPRSERTLLLLLAAIQFTTNLDFLIILPLGPQYMRLMHLTPAQFNLIVAAYAIAAGISGIVAGFWLDRFDRKNALQGLFLGFATATLLCALAPSYRLLIAARALAGAFGGVTGAVILAIVGDVIPEHRRGKAMGLVMSAFSVASIFGVPLGLVLATDFSWHIPAYPLLRYCRSLCPDSGGHVGMGTAAARSPGRCARAAPFGASAGGAGGTEPSHGFCVHGRADRSGLHHISHRSALHGAERRIN
jgi:MFS family permease